MNSTVITSLHEYIHVVERICISFNAYTKSTTHPWFRGQGNSSWGLLPKIYREGEYSLLEREMTRDFEQKAHAFVEKLPTTRLEWMFLMQHYGIPTRLLDWSESHLAALYFAVLSIDDKNDCAVWVIEPWSINSSFHGIYSVISSQNMKTKEYELDFTKDDANDQRNIEAELPIAIRPSRNSPRIVAQKGTFTIHGAYNVGLDEIVKDIPGVGLEKIIIKGDSKLEIMRQLYIAGITHSVLFPDLDGLSREISFRYSHAYMA